MREPDVRAHQLDVTPYRCPMPLLKLKQLLFQIESGEYIELYASDAGSVVDIPAFIQRTSHRLLESKQLANGDYYFYVQKA